MLITELRPQKGHLVGLYSDGELIVSIDSDIIAEKAIKPMRDYPVETLQELLTQSQLRRAKARALYLLEFRDYSRRDMKTRLKRDEEFDEDSAEAAVEYLTEIGAIDDSRYAENMIRHLIHRKHYGRRRIMQELAGKGIDRATAEEALEPFDADEQAAILDLLQGKFSRDLGDEKGIRRTVATLQRYGYSTGDIYDALRTYGDTLQESGDECE